VTSSVNTTTLSFSDKKNSDTSSSFVSAVKVGVKGVASGKRQRTQSRERSVKAAGKMLFPQGNENQYSSVVEVQKSKKNAVLVEY
jgi:hypothetical protein